MTIVLDRPSDADYTRYFPCVRYEWAKIGEPLPAGWKYIDHREPREGEYFLNSTGGIEILTGGLLRSEISFRMRHILAKCCENCESNAVKESDTFCSTCRQAVLDKDWLVLDQLKGEKCP